ncbi:MAG TPA: hypothetical protein VF518_06065 [Polyangia bacterium]
MGSPPDTAWALARRWPGARLTFISNAGHKGSASLRNHIAATLDTFAQ